MPIIDNKCTGCHGCFNICPTNAISMHYDEEGFLYPQIDSDICIECGLCDQACPINDDVTRNEETQAYVAYNQDSSQRKNSSSGGVFILLAEWIISQNGIVYGAVFNENFHVMHTRVTKNLSSLQTSKYVQSEIGNCFKQVAEDLKNYKVLFSGTPCQISGLKKYLQVLKINDNELFTVDIICHGVPSPIIWEQYLKELSGKRVPDTINFRDKSMSWKRFSLTIGFKNGETYSKVLNDDLFMKGFLNNLFLRPACYECKYKQVERVSDITLGDFWGIEKISANKEFDDGASAVIIHTPKGKTIWESIENKLYSEKTTVENVTKDNSAMISSVKPDSNRQEFFSKINIQNGNVIRLLKNIYEPSYGKRIKRKIISLFSKK